MKFKRHFQLLKKELNTDDSKVKSSYWKDGLQDFIISDDNTLKINNFGFGNLEPNTFLRKIYHNFFLRIIYGSQIFSTKWYKLFKIIAAAQDKVIGLDTMRHVFTFEFLENELFQTNIINTICIIGDGRSNFVSPCLVSKRFSKIISINLTETLICDLLLLEKDGFAESDHIGIAISVREINQLLNDNKTKLILVPAQYLKILNNIGINLFVNMCSFQEMNKDVIDEYFKIIKSNNSYLYCCNREKKILPDGETVEFRKYPFGNPTIIVEEECPWTSKYYDYHKYPFIFKYETILHTLVKYNDSK